VGKTYHCLEIEGKVSQKKTKNEKMKRSSITIIQNLQTFHRFILVQRSKNLDAE
jgi:hypothetical protein